MLSCTREAWISITRRGNKNNVTLHTKSNNEIMELDRISNSKLDTMWIMYLKKKLTC